MSSAEDQTMGQSQGSFPTKCTVCGALADAPLACKDCHQVYEHVMGANYFELFGLDPTFDIDASALHQRYLTVCRNVHPDQFANEPTEVVQLAMRLSAQLNRAYDTLKDPHLRAEYLLESQGGKSAAEHKAVPPALLQEVMALREQIEDAKSTQDADALGDVRDRVTARRSQVLAEIARLARQLGDHPDEQTLTDLRETLNTMKYFENLMMQL